MADPVLKAQGLAVGHDRRPAASSLAFQLEPGATLALVGGNGSGKTTLLRTLAGLLPPLEGTLEVLGGSPARAGRRLAWLGQSQSFNPLLPLRARDVVRMAFYPGRGLFGRLSAQDEAAVDGALEFFGAGGFARRPISDLSGGQRQRVYLAYTWARQADLVLLDEPVSNLDVGGMDLYARAIEGFQARGAAVVVATHNLDDAAACDRALILSGGRGEFIPGAEVRHHHGH